MVFGIDAMANPKLTSIEQKFDGAPSNALAFTMMRAPAAPAPSGKSGAK
jgi:hypothetical protein